MYNTLILHFNLRKMLKYKIKKKKTKNKLYKKKCLKYNKLLNNVMVLINNNYTMIIKLIYQKI